MVWQFRAAYCVLVSIMGFLATGLIHADPYRHLSPVTDADFFDDGRYAPEKVELGRMLFFDKILSGNLNISCASCHHPLTHTGDGLSLPVGEGGRGLGVTRDVGSGMDTVHERVPRHSPALFNLGAFEFDTMFHDGRVSVDNSFPSGFASPAGIDLPLGLDNVLAVQAMFPVTSATEMAGQAGENAQADVAAAGQLAGPGGVWDLLAQKLRLVPEYVTMFESAFPGSVEQAEDITFVHAANAIAAFEANAWRSDNSPFDRYLRGNHSALSSEARAGMKLFYGKAGCSDCHSGKFQTDQDFHAIAMPQLGPGKGDNQPGFDDGKDDFGLERVTGLASDRFRFRTPSLRNVALTPPYGHAGAYRTLRSVVEHHLDPLESLGNFDQSQVALPLMSYEPSWDFSVQNDVDRQIAIAEANELLPMQLSQAQVDQILAFLNALTDPDMLDLRHDIPTQVPSGLPLYE